MLFSTHYFIDRWLQISDLSAVDPEFDIQDLTYENNTQYLETLTNHLNATDFLGISVCVCMCEFKRAVTCHQLIVCAKTYTCCMV